MTYGYRIEHFYESKEFIVSELPDYSKEDVKRANRAYPHQFSWVSDHNIEKIEQTLLKEGWRKLNVTS